MCEDIGNTKNTHTAYDEEYREAHLRVVVRHAHVLNLQQVVRCAVVPHQRLLKLANRFRTKTKGSQTHLIDARQPHVQLSNTN